MDPTPRIIPGRIKLALHVSGFNFLFGFLFFAIGFPISFVMIKNADISSLFISTDSYVATSGNINSVEPTNGSINKRTIMQYNYTYTVGAISFNGTSYSSTHNYSAGDAVKILYDKTQPKLSLIEDMNRSQFGGIFLVTLIFPLLGLIFMVVGIRNGQRDLKILTNGILSKGTFVRKEATGAKINNQMVYRIYFKFKDSQGQIVEAMAKSHKPYLVQDEETEPIIYMANNPQKATMVDLLPKGVRKYLEETSF